MILGNTKESIETKSLHPMLKKAINYLRTADFSKLENKKYPIDGDKMFVIVLEYKTLPKSEKKAECHKKYIDVQYIISGKELVGVGLQNPGNKLLQEYSEENDVMFYKTVSEESEVALSSGMYAVFFPTDIHRPGYEYQKECTIRKAVIKIAVELLG